MRDAIPVEVGVPSTKFLQDLIIRQKDLTTTQNELRLSLPLFNNIWKQLIQVTLPAFA